MPRASSSAGTGSRSASSPSRSRVVTGLVTSSSKASPARHGRDRRLDGRLLRRRLDAIDGPAFVATVPARRGTGPAPLLPDAAARPSCACRPRRGPKPDRSGHLRPRRRARRLRDLVGRGPGRRSRRSTGGLDPRRPGRGHGRELARRGRGSCASASDLDAARGRHRAGDRRRVSSPAIEREGAPIIDGAVEAVRRIAAERPVAVASSAHPEVIARGPRRHRAWRDVFRGRRLVRRGRARQAGAGRLPRGGAAARRRPPRPASSSRTRSTASGPAKAAGMTVVLVPNCERPAGPGRARAGGPRARPTRGPRPVGDRPAGRTRGRRAAAAAARPIHPLRRTVRYWRVAAPSVVDPRSGRISGSALEGRERLPAGPAIYCFNHLSWSDPFVLMAVLPCRPRLFFFGPKEEDMARRRPEPADVWTGTAIPYRPGKNDLLEATRRVGAVLDGRRRRRDRRRGADPRRASASSCRSARERRTSRCAPACRSSRSRSTARAGCGSAAGSGSGWGSRSPIDGRPTREAVDDAHGRADWTALHDLVADAPDVPPSRAGRALAHRALQRLAGGLARGRPRGVTRARCPVCAYVADAWHTRTDQTRRAWQRPGCRPIRRNTGRRLAEQTDEQIDAWAAELMRDVVDPARRSSRSSTTSAARPGSTSAASNGCSLLAAGPPAVDRARRDGPPDGAGDHALRPRAGHPRPGPGRPRAADRVPRRELRGDRLRLTRTGRSTARLAAPARRPGPPRSIPFPSLLDGLVVGAVALIAGGGPGDRAAARRSR